MATSFNNELAEALLLDIRAGRAAARQSVGAERGAFLLFPTSVVVAGRVGAQLVYPLHVLVEPGSVATSAGSSEVAGVVAGTAVSGRFGWTVGGDPPPEAHYRFRRRGREVPAPAWAAQLPRSERLPAEEPERLARLRARYQRRRRDAEHRLLALSERVVRSSCRGPVDRALRYRPALDVDDLVQRSLQTAARLLPLYSSPQRPPCSWLGMLRLDSRRDLHRELSRFDWLPGEAAAAVALAQSCGIGRRCDPDDTLAALTDAAERFGLPCPDVDAAQLDLALRTAGALEHEISSFTAVPGPEPADIAVAEVLATVAGLVVDDDDTVARAARGDPVALEGIGEGVLRRLNGSRAGRPAARRCWEQFQRTGRFFSSPAGVAQFGALVGAERLAQLDEYLCRASGRPALAPA
jgi:hypothetical protein